MDKEIVTYKDGSIHVVSKFKAFIRKIFGFMLKPRIYKLEELFNFDKESSK